MHLMNDDILLKNRLVREKNETISALRKKLCPESEESAILRTVEIS